jgi:hypothetical protein
MNLAKAIAGYLPSTGGSSSNAGNILGSLLND